MVLLFITLYNCLDISIGTQFMFNNSDLQLLPPKIVLESPLLGLTLQENVTFNEDEISMPPVRIYFQHRSIENSVGVSCKAFYGHEFFMAQLTVIFFSLMSVDIRFKYSV